MTVIHDPSRKTWRVPWHLVLIFFLLAGGILGLGYSFYSYQVRFLQSLKAEELKAFVDLKVRQIETWRRNHINDALLIVNDSDFANQIQNWFYGEGTGVPYENIKQHLGELNRGGYVATVLFDLQGRVRMSVWEVETEHLPLIRKVAAEAMKTGNIILTDLYVIHQADEINLSLAVPILLRQNSKTAVIGAVVYQIDINYFLNPILQSWPTDSKTGEFVLVRRNANNNGIVVLNELRHRKGAPLVLQEPLTATHMPCVKAALGEEGIVRGRDYRNQPVLAANRAIADSPWFLTAKIDLAEVNAPLHKWLYLIPILTLSMMATASLGVALIWRHRDAQFYRQQYRSESERRALSQRYEYLTKYANDIILLTDKDEKIIEANDRAVDSYGYGRDELLHLHLRDLVPERRSERVPGNLDPETQDDFRFEATNYHKDGTTFPAEISSSLIEQGDNCIYQYIIRDVSERKSKEKALRESEKQLRFLSSQLLMVQENERRRIAKELHDELGQVLMILKFQISSIDSRLTKTQEPLKDECQDLLHYLDDSIENVRRLSHDLSPSTLEQFGLANAIKNLLENFSKHYKVEWEPSQLDSLDNFFSPSSQTHIYRIFQESLTNIGRHAQATNILIDIEKRDAYVNFVIEDNGRGFDPQAVMNRKESPKGIGLVTISERTRMVGGRLVIRSGKAGTRLTLTIPLESESNE